MSRLFGTEDLLVSPSDVPDDAPGGDIGRAR
jgi:hypothetical protein